MYTVVINNNIIVGIQNRILFFRVKILHISLKFYLKFIHAYYIFNMMLLFYHISIIQ